MLALEGHVLLLVTMHPAGGEDLRVREQPDVLGGVLRGRRQAHQAGLGADPRSGGRAPGAPDRGVADQPDRPGLHDRSARLSGRRPSRARFADASTCSPCHQASAPGECSASEPRCTARLLGTGEAPANDVEAGDAAHSKIARGAVGTSSTRATGYKVKRIEVQPHCRLSYQTHAHRAEHWVIVSGKATCLIDGVTVSRRPWRVAWTSRSDRRIGSPMTRTSGWSSSRSSAARYTERGRHLPPRGRLRPQLRAVALEGGLGVLRLEPVARSLSRPASCAPAAATRPCRRSTPPC